MYTEQQCADLHRMHDFPMVSVGKSEIVWSNDPTYRTAQMVKDTEFACKKKAVEREATEAKSAAFEAEQRAHHAATTPIPADAKRFVAQMVKDAEIAWGKKAVEREATEAKSAAFDENCGYLFCT